MQNNIQDKTKVAGKQNRQNALAEFENAPDTALFNQVIIAHVRDCSIATMERDRWAGGGIPFIKMGRAVKYRKSDVMTWLDKHQPQFSTAESVGANRDRKNVYTTKHPINRLDNKASQP